MPGGELVRAGKPICTLYAASASRFAEALHLLQGAVEIGDERRVPPPLIGEAIRLENTRDPRKPYAGGQWDE